MRTELAPDEIMEILIDSGISFDEARGEAISQAVEIHGYDRKLAEALVDRPLFVMRMRLRLMGPFSDWVKR